MEEGLIIPPLVNGVDRGFLSLFIDEVKICRNILLLSRSYDIVVQFQWWGDVLPVVVRYVYFFIILYHPYLFFNVNINLKSKFLL